MSPLGKAVGLIPVIKSPSDSWVNQLLPGERNIKAQVVKPCFLLLTFAHPWDMVRKA